MDYGRVFGLPVSVKSWIEALMLPESMYWTLHASGYTTLLSCAYLEESDIKELDITLPGHRRTLLAGSAQLRAALERVKAKVISTESLPDLASVATPSHDPTPRKRTTICNSAIPRGVAPDYWDRARSRDRFENRIRFPDGIHLLLVRHAQSLANVDMKYYTTHSDYSIPLSEEGTHQAAESGRQIAAYYRRKFKLKPDAPPPANWLCRIWTSPYVRTRQTSKLILESSEGWVTDIQENVLLVEQNFGLFEGADWYSGELDDKYPDELHHYQKAAAFGGRFWAKIPLGESRFDVCMRVSQCFGTIHRDVSRCNIKNFIIVSHGTTLRAFMMMWLRLLPEWFEEEPNPSNASIRVIDDYQDEGYIWPLKEKSEPIIDNSILTASKIIPISDEVADVTITPSTPTQSDSHLHHNGTTTRQDNATSESPARPEEGTDTSAPVSVQPLLYIRKPTTTTSTHSTGHSSILNHHLLLPTQYGGSEDALLKSSASAHPVNSSPLRHSQQQRTVTGCQE